MSSNHRCCERELGFLSGTEVGLNCTGVHLNQTIQHIVFDFRMRFTCDEISDVSVSEDMRVSAGRVRFCLRFRLHDFLKYVFLSLEITYYNLVLKIIFGSF